MKIVITGTPGVGKHTVAESLSNFLDNASVFDINKIIFSENLLTISSHDAEGLEVDTDRTRDHFSLILSEGKSQNSIIVGHLAPYVIDSKLVDLVIILRRSPYELKKIYDERSYSPSKTKDNMNAEILGFISYDSSKTFEFSKLSELINSINILPSLSAQKIITMISNEKLRSFGEVDWLSLVQNDPDMLEYLVKSHLN
ncbi:shikimate kinase [Candidatus Nitrosocosmicus sp. SS]|nr:AAA family ATPase [Candidatus Nitrosocosmicus sp. SS]KAF0867999.1 shikimate kinase [Candidatus Nitrosocosmicus sp. SS]